MARQGKDRVNRERFLYHARSDRHNHVHGRTRRQAHDHELRGVLPALLREHADPRTRAIHYAGTLFAIALLVFAVATGRWWLILLAVVSGYAFAWVAHFFVEKNRPATFTYPWWSYISDFRMLWLFLTGRLGPELDKAGVGRG